MRDPIPNRLLGTVGPQTVGTSLCETQVSVGSDPKSVARDCSPPDSRLPVTPFNLLFRVLCRQVVFIFVVFVGQLLKPFETTMRANSNSICANLYREAETKALPVGREMQYKMGPKQGMQYVAKAENANAGEC